ncbi:DnaB-like helicase C-terminal domain-containing protein [Rhizobium leguminosarum]|uniref:DnaB-like helicase C-terminal domain-containing protein n=1 Tax=Rhizobium leguminosarum TaxID=384 RepID=UPI003F9CA247
MKNTVVRALADDGIDDLNRAAKRALRTVSRRFQNVEHGVIQTNISAIDSLLEGGINRGEIVFLTGDEDAKKILLSLDIGYNIAAAYQASVSTDGSTFADRGGVVGYYSTKMSAENIATAIISDQTNISTDDIKSGNITENEFQVLVECSMTMQKIPLYIDDKKEDNLEELLSKFRIIKKNRGLDVIIIDNFDEFYRNGRQDKISNLSNELIDFATELDLAVICLAEHRRYLIETLISPTVRFIHCGSASFDSVTYNGISLTRLDKNSEFGAELDHKDEKQDIKNLPNRDFLARAVALPTSPVDDAAVTSTIQDIVNFLGGPVKIGRSVNSSADLARLVQDGLPVTILEKFTIIGLTPSELETIVAPKRTLARRRTIGRLTPSEGDATVRLAKIVLLAISVLGTSNLALGWLRQPQDKRLGGRAPMNLLVTEVGATAVEDLLLRAAFGFNA